MFSFAQHPIVHAVDPEGQRGDRDRSPCIQMRIGFAGLFGMSGAVKLPCAAGVSGLAATAG